VDHLKINGIHLMGVSLGSIISMQMYHSRPLAIKSMVFAGPIVALNNKLRIWAKIGLTTAKIIGYRNFYALMSKVVMPRKNHQKSRDIFVRESKLLSNLEYKKWTSMYGKYLDVKLKQLFDACPEVPTFILVGKQDHMFFKPAMEYAQRFKNIQIQIVDRCGHLVSLEKADIFNQHCKAFFDRLLISK
jgi:pimeloyl-ACP methyl ester carboxylesterase